MNVTYKIFDAWHELDNEAEICKFMAYQIRSGKIIALNYSDMRRLFLMNSKKDIINSNVKLLSGLEDALSTGKNSALLTCSNTLTCFFLCKDIFY